MARVRVTLRQYENGRWTEHVFDRWPPPPPDLTGPVERYWYHDRVEARDSSRPLTCADAEELKTHLRALRTERLSRGT